MSAVIGSWALFALLIYCPQIRANPDTKRLYDDLLTNYNRLIRPVVNSSDQLTVKMGLKLSQIIGVDMKRQIMITNVWVEQEWVDYKLKWDPRDYGGVRYLHVPSQNIWLPDIVLYNNADGNYEVTIMTKAELHHSGRVTWRPPAIYKSSCEIDVEFFPFDEQMCSMKFGSWSYDGYMVELRHINQRGAANEIEMGLDLREYYISTEWDIMTAPAVRHEKYYPCCEEPFYDIIFYLSLRRKSLFYTVNVIIPCVGISFLSVLVFYLPSQSGEKVSLSISILLSLTVFFLLLAEIIPSTSMAVPLLGKYLLFTMILVTCSVVVTIIVLNVNFRTPATHKMAPWVRTLFVETLPRYLFLQRPQPELSKDPDEIDEKMYSRERVNDLKKMDDNWSDLTDSVETAFSDADSLSSDEDEGLGLELASGAGDDSPVLISFDKSSSVNRSGPDKSGQRSESWLNPQPTWNLSPTEAENVQLNRQSRPVSQNHLSLSSTTIHKTSSHIMISSVRPQPEAVDPNQVAVMKETKPRYGAALNSLKFVARHVYNQDKYDQYADDWKYVAMVLDRILLWIFAIACIVGTASIIMAAPSHYDLRKPIDVQLSKVVDRQNTVILQLSGSNNVNL